MNLIIYSTRESPRLAYMLDFVFNTVLLCEFEITTDLNQFRTRSGFKLNYSSEDISDCIQIVPHTILFEKRITPQNLDLFKWREQKAFFKTSTNEIPFDIFAAGFYLLSRYEEYLVNEKDEFGRFPHTESLAFKNDFLHIPLVDIWLTAFKQTLKTHYPDLHFGQKEFHFLPTYDIDIAYSYKHKSFMKTIGGWIQDLYHGKKNNRINVLLSKEKDPYDCYDKLNVLHEQYQLNPIYFFLLGRGGKLDKNLNPKNNGFKKLIQQIAKKYSVGIHPSYRSNDHEEELMVEIERLNSITSMQTARSRQHYIRFSLSYTYDNLVSHQIKDDYSMGYGSINGFRASTSNSFFWFDLSTNELSDLCVHPFCFMECNSFFEQKQNTVQTKEELLHYINEVKKVHGTFISIWHNFSLGSDPLWQGWYEVYQYQLDLIKKVR